MYGDLLTSKMKCVSFLFGELAKQPGNEIFTISMGVRSKLYTGFCAWSLEIVSVFSQYRQQLFLAFSDT